MKIKKTLFLVLISFLTLSIIIKKQQKPNGGELLQWNSSLKLKWTDFKAVPDKTSSHKAVTTSIIQTESIFFTNDSIAYNVICYFNKHKSWAKENGTAQLLNHEQLHFDMAELITRKIRKDFSAYKFKSTKDASEMIKIIFEKWSLERTKIGKQYDEETNHGIIVIKQKEWEQKIALELKHLEKYALTRVDIIKLK